MAAEVITNLPASDPPKPKAIFSPGLLFYEIAPLLDSICGSKWSDPETERSSSVVNLLTPGDPWVDPSRVAAPRCRLVRE